MMMMMIACYNCHSSVNDLREDLREDWCTGYPRYTTEYRSKSGRENHNLGYQRLPPFTERIVLSNRDKIYDLTLVTLNFSTFIVALKVQDLKQI